MFAMLFAVVVVASVGKAKRKAEDVPEGAEEGIEEGIEAAAATPLAMEVLVPVLVGVEVLPPLEFAKAADGVVANGLDANPAIDVGEKEGTEVGGRELVGVLVVKVLGEDAAPVATAVFVQTALAVTVTVTLPSAPVEVEGAPANAGVKSIGVPVAGVAAVEGGGRVFWLDGADGKVVEVLGTALAGVKSGEVGAEELILCS